MNRAAIYARLSLADENSTSTERMETGPDLHDTTQRTPDGKPN
jgi:hypothetical protein